jgi:hypothetical protein
MEEGYRTGHLCPFCGIKGNGRGVQDRSYFYFQFLPKGKEEGHWTCHLCTFCGYQREWKRGTGQVIFVLSVVTKGKGRGVQDRASLYFLFLSKGKEEGYRTCPLRTLCGYQRERKRGTGRVIFVLSVLTKGKGRWVQDRSSLYFLFLPKSKEEGHWTGQLCTFCGYQRERKTGTGQVIFVLSGHRRERKRGTGQVIFVRGYQRERKRVQDRSYLYFLFLPKRREEGYRTGHLCTFWGYQREKKRGTVPDRSSLYFLWLPKGNEEGYRTGQVIFVHSVVTKGKGRWVQDMSSLYFLWLPKGKEEWYRTGHLCTFCSYQREYQTFPDFTENSLSLFTHVFYLPRQKIINT